MLLRFLPHERKAGHRTESEFSGATGEFFHSRARVRCVRPNSYHLPRWRVRVRWGGGGGGGFARDNFFLRLRTPFIRPIPVSGFSKF